MKLFRRIFFCFSFAIAIISCSEKKHKKVSQSLKAYQASRDSLISKYSATNNDDTTISQFAYQYQNVFIDKGRLLSITGEITDILKKTAVIHFKL